MRLEAETTLTKPLLRKYLHWMLIENQKKRLAVVQLLGALLIALSFGLIWIAPTDAAGYIGLALTAAILAGFFTLPRWAASLRFRGMPEDMKTQRFVFLDDAFVADLDAGERLKGHSTVRYDGLVKAVEDKDVFYLFIRKDNAFVVAKADFTVGNPKDLGERLAKLPGGRFVHVK
jgi:hypothetical protein